VEAEASCPRENAGGVEQEAAVAAGVAQAAEMVAQAEAAAVVPRSSGCLGIREGHCRTPRASPASPACSTPLVCRRNQGTTLADRCTRTSIQHRRSVSRAEAAAVVRVVVVVAEAVAAVVRVVVVTAAVAGMEAVEEEARAAAVAVAVKVVQEEERAVASGGSTPHSQSSESRRTLLPMPAIGGCTSPRTRVAELEGRLAVTAVVVMATPRAAAVVPLR